MRKVTPLFAVLAVTCVSVGKLAAYQNPNHQQVIAECNRLATSPYDPKAQANGVETGDLDAAAVIAACSQAVRFQATPRLQYQYGRGLRKGEQYPEALRWYREAAEQGNAAAQHELGLMYYYGEGTPQDAEAGTEWIERAAVQGLAVAQNDIGAFYHAGRGVTQDFRRAALYYGLAGQQGLGFAQLNLGGLYFNGDGVSQDSAQAAYWFTMASQSDDANAAKEGRVWSERLQERARQTIARRRQLDPAFGQPNNPFSEGFVAGLIFLAVLLALGENDGGDGYTPAPGQQQFVPIDPCAGWGGLSPACGG